jgi:hypothetical protein
MKNTLLIFLLSISSLTYAWPGANSTSQAGKEILFASYEITDVSTLKSNLTQIISIVSSEAKVVLFIDTIESINIYSLYNQKHAMELLNATLEVGQKLISDYPELKNELSEPISKAQKYFLNMKSSVPINT